MLVDLDAYEGEAALDCEICLIGGGAVGLVMAAALARKGIRVVVLEAGGVQLERASQELCKGISVGHPFRNIEVGRYRVLGGGTTFWGGQVLRFSPTTFASRPWVFKTAWPFGSEVMEPYYRQAFQAIGLADAIHDDDQVWARLGVSPPELGPDLELPLTRWVPQRNFARLLSAELDAAKNLMVVTHANAVAFTLDERRRRVLAVRARSLRGRQLAVRARAMIVANGTLEIARLLLQPAADHGATPWQDNPWLGRGFADHLDSVAGEVEVDNKKKFENTFDNIFIDGHKYYPKIRLSHVVQREEKLLDVAAQFQFRSRYSHHIEAAKMFVGSLRDGRRPDNLRAMPRHVLGVAGIALPLMVRYLSQHRSFKPRDAKVFLTMFCEQMPNPRSTIRLGRGVDALGVRHLEVDWTIDGRELRTMAFFARRLRDRFAELGLARIRIDPDLDREDRIFLTKVHDAVHQMSTARIGMSACEGVVDSDLRVHGTDNLYVAGAAVFPTTGFANPTLTAIALGLRLCDHLEGHLHG